MRYLLLLMLGASLTACDAANEAATDAALSNMDGAMNSVAEDQIEVYEIAKRNSDMTQACVQAGMIAQIYLEGKNENKWKEWKTVADEDCASAGMPNL